MSKAETERLARRVDELEQQMAELRAAIAGAGAALAIAYPSRPASER